MFKTRFSDEELKWLSPYNEGDTLIFRSANGDLDTSWIVQKIIYHAECNPIASHGTHRYHTGRIFYQNSKAKYPSGGKELLGIKKYTDRTAIDIFYLNNSFLLYDLDKMIDITGLTDVERIEKDKIFILSDLHPKSKPDEIEFLYWHEEHGIIKYITHGGLEWKRINLDFEVK